jgi:hypothetical protein
MPSASLTFSTSPRALVLCALLGQDEATFLVFFLKNEGLDHITDGDNLIRVDIVLDGKFTDRDDTLRLVTDVEENLVAVNLYDGSFNEVSVVEELQRFFNFGEEILG